MLTPASDVEPSDAREEGHDDGGVEGLGSPSPLFFGRRRRRRRW